MATDADLTFEITWDGRTDTIRPAEFTADEIGAFRRAVGFSLNAGMQDLDLDVFAGLVWIYRRRDNPKLTYEQVSKSLSYADVIDMADDELGDDGDPEA